MARYIYVFRKKMKGLEDHVEVSINPEASFQCSVDRRIIPDQWSRLVDYWHSAKFQNHKIVLLQTHNTTIVFQVQAMILQRMRLIHYNLEDRTYEGKVNSNCLGVLAHLFMYLPTVLLISAAGAHSWDRLFCGWGTVLAKELFCRGPRQNSWEM